MVMDILRQRERKDEVVGTVRKSCRDAHGVIRDAVDCGQVPALSRGN